MIPFLNRVIAHTEAGLIQKTYDCFEKLASSACRFSGIAVIQNLDEYLREYSDFSDLALDNFRHMFACYAIFCSLVLIAFCGHRLVKLAKKVKFSHR